MGDLRRKYVQMFLVSLAAAFYDVEDSALQNVDVMTDISMAPTAFTRYTVAPSHLSKSSKYVSHTTYPNQKINMTITRRSSRSKRKNERKNESGRKGTADEEEYLLRSLEKLAARFNALQGEHVLVFVSSLNNVF